MALSPTDPQQAYRDFMLQGRGAVTPTTTSSSTSRTCSPRSPSKKTQSILQAFYKTLEQDWWGIDNVLCQVVASIAELRQRGQVVQRQQQQQHLAHHVEGAAPGWNTTTNNNNNHHHYHQYLTNDDLELAQCHGIRKHEKALYNLRSLLAQLGQTQDALARRLADVLTELTTDDDDEQQQQQRYMTRLYQTAALDLYQKQTWGQELLNPHGEWTEQARLAKTIAAQWSRSHSKSPWQQISSFLGERHVARGGQGN